MADRSHTELFSLLPSVCLSKQFDIDLTVDKLIKNLEMIYNALFQQFLEVSLNVGLSTGKLKWRNVKKEKLK